ncbi:methyl-accepting chemotaxis protein [Bacillus niameyensis]|uniref:methyl-accepting chemotaxis protein n=1 Tax=Bacillus niameyensis TaxID=1522308 RepID=UPI0007810870|nr:methyl-accepting chemotaxis protein [Bacillus niameyensis]
MRKIFQFNSIKKKLIFGFSIILFLVVLLGFYNYLAIKALNKNTNEIVKEQLPLLIANEEMALNMSERNLAVRGYLLYGDPQLKEEYQLLKEEGRTIEKKVLQLTDTTKAKELIEKSSKWEEFSDRVFSEYDAGNKDKAVQIMDTEVRPLGNEILTGFKDLAKTRGKNIFEDGKYVENYSKVSLILDIIISLVIVGLGLLVSLVMARIISKPIVSIVNRMKMIASGDLSGVSLEVKSKDEIGQLVLATNEMTDRTKALLKEINLVTDTVSSQSEELTQAANEVKTGMEQIAVTMEELATGSETQANSASDLASIMGTFSDRVEEANENGGHIQENSKKVLAMTTLGSELMNSSTEQMIKIDHIVKEAVEKVRNLDGQSQEISKLISVIKDVADQTNLLALNAAIEAARAGEHGKGFAVVAEEVKNLAEQVAISVKDITHIVTNIQNETSVVANSLQNGYSEVEQGTNQIKRTDQTFNEISSAVSDMARSINYITSNLAEVTNSAREMNHSIEEVASVSEEAAAGVEQTAASAQQASSSMEEVSANSDHLVKRIEELNKLVSQFKL